MRKQSLLEKKFEFCFPHLDTLVLVEESEDEVVIRATRNTFSEQRKIRFIHELAAEGFISDSYQQVSSLESASWLRVRWLKDASWLKLDAAQVARTRTIMVRLLLGSAVLWSTTMAMLFLR